MFLAHTELKKTHASCTIEARGLQSDKQTTQSVEPQISIIPTKIGDTQVDEVAYSIARENFGAYIL